MIYMRFIGPDGCEHIVEGKQSEEGYYSFPFPHVIEPGEYWTIGPIDAESRRQPKKVGGGGKERGGEIESD